MQLSKVNSIIWFIPEITNVYAGGIVTILKISQYFSINYGTKNIFVTDGLFSESNKKIISEKYAGILYDFILLKDSNKIFGDVAICTFWTTAFNLLKFNNCKKKFYLVQDDERCFYPHGSVRELVESTYRFGFYGLVNSNNIFETYNKFQKCMRFLPGIDDSLITENKIRKDGTTHIVVYSRPSHVRNCFEIVLLASRKIAEIYKDSVVFHYVGESFNSRDYNLPSNCIVHGNISSQSKVKEIYSLCDIGISFISTPTVSYHQLDLLKSKICLICNKNGEIENLFNNDEVVFCDATVSDLIYKLSEVLENKDIIYNTIDNSLNKLNEFSWDKCLYDISQYIRNK
ncbi:rhamnosyltransferase WsaF family glycosyltransferase [Vibrio spartinae]|uniref:rhamnosyltransferase WsaF family glycosyltransferase n=1 Tax=Vibrio spartinae TaxID=1918945 RepID=UPI001115206A|nr:glycosyltransferase family 4 protein [Vibrio spartinae]